MPSYISEIRERQALEASKQSSPVPIVVAAIAAFAIGAMGAMGFIRLPAMMGKSAPKETTAVASAAHKPEPVAVAAGWGRLGKAEKANILLSCVPRHKLLGGGPWEPGRKIDSADLYRILQVGSHISRAASIIGVQQTVVSETAFASLWADVADCAMSQNGWTLCDPDNRALAVEAVLTVVRQVESAAKPRRETDFDRVWSKVEGKNKRSKDYELYAARATRDRVLDNLRRRVQEGRFVASDFGYFPPAEVSRVLTETKPLRDACAEKR